MERCQLTQVCDRESPYVSKSILNCCGGEPMPMSPDQTVVRLLASWRTVRTRDRSPRAKFESSRATLCLDFHVLCFFSCFVFLVGLPRTYVSGSSKPTPVLARSADKVR